MKKPGKMNQSRVTFFDESELKDGSDRRIKHGSLLVGRDSTDKLLRHQMSS